MLPLPIVNLRITSQITAMPLKYYPQIFLLPPLVVLLAINSSEATAAQQDSLLSKLLVADSVESAKSMIGAHQESVAPSLLIDLMARAEEHYNRDEHARARLVSEIAKVIAEKLGDRPQVAKAHHQTGRAYFAEGNLKKALESYLISQSMMNEAGSANELVYVLKDIGVTYREMGDRVRARELFSQSLRLANDISDRKGVAYAEMLLGNLSAMEGDYAPVLPRLERALDLFRESGEQYYVADALANMGDYYRDTGEFSAALSHYAQAINIVKDSGPKRRVVRMLTNLALLHINQGYHDEARSTLMQAIELIERAGDKRQLAINYILLGEVYREQNDLEGAVNYLTQSRDIARSLGLKRTEAGAIAGLGNVYAEQGKYSLAEEHLDESLRLNSELKGRPIMAGTMWSYSRLYNLKGEHQRAVEYADRAIQLAKGGAPEELFLSLTSKGRSLYSLKDYPRAAQTFNEAIALAERLSERATGPAQSRAQFIERKLDAYWGMISLLVEQNRTAEALRTAEQVKNRVLLDILVGGRLNVTKQMTPAERSQEQRLKSEVSRVSSELDEEQSKAQIDKTRVSELESLLNRAAQEYELFEADLYTKYPELQARRARSPLVNLEEVGELLRDADTAFLEYVIGNERSYLFVCTKPSNGGAGATKPVDLRVYSLPITRKELAALVGTFHSRVSGHRDDYDEIGQQLYDRLIKPAARQISNKKKLGIVPDATLWTLPFDALQNGTRYLVQDHQTFFIPSLTVLREMRKRPTKSNQHGSRGLKGEPTYLAFADPNLDSPVIDQMAEVVRGKKFAPLPETRNEIAHQKRYFGSGRYSLYVGRDAREARLKSQAPDFSFIHLATHGVFDDRSPMSSFLLMAPGGGDGGEDGQLMAREMIDLDLQSSELVVLSACETAKGRITGEGILGMTWALFVAGSPTTLGSLWSVESKSTSIFMDAFYQNLFETKSRARTKPHVPKAAARRQAELSLLKSVDYNHPYFWAGFVLIGDPE